MAQRNDRNVFRLVIDRKGELAYVERVTNADNIKRCAKDDVQSISIYSTKKQADRTVDIYNKNKVVEF